MGQPSEVHRMVVRDVLDNGLRLITETMPHVRSVTIGVWLMRGSRHESDERSGIAHFVEHMLFKGTHNRSAEDIAQAIDSIGGQLDAFTAKEYASYYIKVLDEHLPLAVDLLADIVMRPAFARRRDRARKKSHPRRNQDGRGHARRPRSRAVHPAFLGRPSARTANPRVERNRRRFYPRDAARILPQRLRRAQHDHLRGRQSRSCASARARRDRVQGDLAQMPHRSAASRRASVLR